MSPCIVTTERDLEAYIDGVMGPDGSRETVLAVADRIKSLGHPAWGSDWSEYLDALDPWHMVEHDRSQQARGESDAYCV
jgi:hypothetical protein